MNKTIVAARVGRLAIGFGIGVAMIAGPGCSSQGNEDGSEANSSTSADELSAAEIMARADAYVASNVLYCQAPAGQYYDGDEACYPNVACPNPSPEKPWHDYRTDCSGFVSYLWQATDDPDTAVYSNDRAAADGLVGWESVPLSQLQAGDALVTEGHIKLFSAYANSQGVNSGAAVIYEEYNCKENARKDTQAFRQVGNDEIEFEGDSGRYYHGIRRLGLTKPTPPVTIAHETAFQANTSSLWTVGSAGERDWKLGMKTGTSPSIAALRDGTYLSAFQANTGSLWTAGPGNIKDWKLGMKAGTSPSIAALTGGGYVIAFQANTGNLWVADKSGARDLKLGMRAGTSPSVVGLSNGGYEIAFQANNGWLWTTGSANTRNWKLGLDAESSPSIGAVANNGYEVAFQSNGHDLWTVGNVEDKHWRLGLKAGTSPSIVGLPGNKYNVAFEANTDALWSAGSAGIIDWKLGMRSGTSPSIAPAAGGGYDIVFEANTGVLWSASSSNGAGKSLGRGMMLGTSPSGS